MDSVVPSRFINQHSRVFAVIYDRDQLDTALPKSVFKRKIEPQAALPSPALAH
jgi:hypothetical protein